MWQGIGGHLLKSGIIIRQEVFNEKEEKEIHAKIKEEAVKLLTEQGYLITEAARNLGVNENVLGGFVAFEKTRLTKVSIFT